MWRSVRQQSWRSWLAKYFLETRRFVIIIFQTYAVHYIFFLVAALRNLLRPPARIFHRRHRLHLRQPPVHFPHRHLVMMFNMITVFMIIIINASSKTSWSTCFGIIVDLNMVVIIIIMSNFRLGFLIDFISQPVIAGFTSGAALTIASGQIKVNNITINLFIFTFNFFIITRDGRPVPRGRGGPPPRPAPPRAVGRGGSPPRKNDQSCGEVAGQNKGLNLNFLQKRKQVMEQYYNTEQCPIQPVNRICKRK